MRYLTDRKRAEGKGASHTGTEKHHFMHISAIGLAFLTPLFAYIFGKALGQSHEVVVATFARPVPALVTGLVFFIAMRHFFIGAGSVLDDYARGTWHKVLNVCVIFLSYTIVATVLYALVRIAAL